MLEIFSKGHMCISFKLHAKVRSDSVLGGRVGVGWQGTFLKSKVLRFI